MLFAVGTVGYAPEKIFDWRYFCDPDPVVGGYRPHHDAGRNLVIFTQISDLKPESVLELGCGRGYLLKKFRAEGTRGYGLDVSRHAFLTRVSPGVMQWDLTKLPWPIKDQAVDLCYSVEVLDTIPHAFLPHVVEEMCRVSKRGYHVLDLNETMGNLVPARRTRESRAFWERMDKAHQIVDSQDVLSGPIKMNYNTGPLKINFGSGTEMFYWGWINVDHYPLGDFAKANNFKYSNADLRNSSMWPTENRTTAIVASHLLDRLTSKEAWDFLTNCWTTLMPGGTIRIAVPDREKLVKMATDQKLDYFDGIGPDVTEAKDTQAKLASLLHYGSGESYDRKSLMELLAEVGFSRIGPMNFSESFSNHIQKETYDTLPDLSLYVEGRKLTI